MTQLTVNEIDVLIEILTKHEHAISHVSIPMAEQLSTAFKGDDSLTRVINTMRQDLENKPEVFARIKVKLYDMKDQLQKNEIDNALADKPETSPKGVSPFRWEMIQNDIYLQTHKCTDSTNTVIGCVWKNDVQECWYGRNWSNREHRYQTKEIAMQEVERCALEGSVV